MEEPFGPDPRDADRFILDPRYDVAPSYPYAATIARQRAALGRMDSAIALLPAWQAVDLGEPGSPITFPWRSWHRLLDPPPYAPDTSTWLPWRTDDRKLPGLAFHDFEARLLAPVVNAECAAALLEFAGSGEARLAGPARALWETLEPRLGWEFANNVPASNPWRDSLALWCVACRPPLLDAMQPLALAIATRLSQYARRRDGRVVGRQFPYNDKFLASATSFLAVSLLVLGQDLDLASRLEAAVSEARNADGSWSDAGNPPDIVTTLAAADLLLRSDPEFDPEPTRTFFDSRRSARGTWTALGPEEPWITSELFRWMALSRRPFPERFRWPRAAGAAWDRKLSIPNYGWYEQVADLFSSIPRLAGQPMIAAFIDLAGFGTFNNRFGQETGDDALRRFAVHLRDSLPSGRPCRDGGDEFLVVGTPTAGGLEAELDAMRTSWPAAFRATFGADVPPVAARIVAVPCRCGELRAARGALGRSIASLKAAHPVPPAQGVFQLLRGERPL